MKKYILLSTILLFIGCTKTQTTKNSHSEHKKLPAHIMVTTPTTQAIGTPLKGVIIVHDALLSEDINPWKEQDFAIEARDFETNLAYLSLPYSPDFKQTFVSQNPLIGQKLFWIDKDKTIQTGSLTKLAKNEQYSKEDVIITITGPSSHKSMGSPLFDKDGSLVGIIIGGDTASQQIFALRIQDILRFIEKNI